MRRRFLYILLIFTLFGMPFYVSMYALVQQTGGDTPAPPAAEEPQPDTLVKTRFPIAPTQPKTIEDINVERPLDLKPPENVKSEVEYDINTGRYLLKTKLGDSELGTSFSLSADEYMEHNLQRSMQSYFRSKNVEEFEGSDKKKFDLSDMQFDIGPADRIFGPGGVRVTTQGSAELSMGLKTSKTESPTVAERQRSKTIFKFDENVQMNVTAKVGEKVSFNMNYNTRTTFDYDTKKIKLAYEGNEDEIIKTLEAGNVSMTTSNSLIRGGTALFGIKSDLQFGKLRVSLLASQQESQSKSVSSKGGVQTTPFEIKADDYEENQNFFLAYYFRDNYDQAMRTLPYISSPINITKLEVWKTNKRSNFEQVRNVVAFSDLGETDTTHIHNPDWYPIPYPSPNIPNIPHNNGNALHHKLINDYSGARDINSVTQVLQGAGLIAGGEYEKIESATLLNPGTDYTANMQLGYISLKMALSSDEVLGVAFQYTYGGDTYQVGEFSSNSTSAASSSGDGQSGGANLGAIFVKLLKGTAMSPESPYWGIMMRNVYRLSTVGGMGVSTSTVLSVQKEKFRLDIQYQSDTTGLYLNYIPGVTYKGKEGQPPDTKPKTLVKLMNLDRLNSTNDPYPDGFFDFVDGFTINAANGKVIFPVVEPFGSHLESLFQDSTEAAQYTYKELYTMTKTQAQQVAEKNKFLMRGEYKSSKSGTINLGAMNVSKESVRVTAGGVVLTQDQYQVSSMGEVTITDQGVIDGGAPITVTLEDRGGFNMQRKTMLGMNLDYDINPNFTIGGTIMHLYEVPLTMKIDAGNESLKNTLWGLNASYSTQSQLLTNILDKLPLLQLTKPSQISFKSEFAHLIPGHYENKYGGGYSYMDDFESAQQPYPIGFPPSEWMLSSVPANAKDNTDPLFPESEKVDDVKYGYNRAHLAWYDISSDMTGKNSSVAPSYLRNDLDQLSNHYVREVYQYELFPNRDQNFGETARLPIFNLAYFPKERGSFNMDTVNIDKNTGYLNNPEKRFGGIMRRMNSNYSNFEAQNVEYIEFWLMDPFLYGSENKEGDLYFNLGEVSEDVLRDERKFAESAMPVSGDTTLLETTAWGKVPKFQGTVYAFDKDKTKIKLQDVGLDGLVNESEYNHHSYSAYVAWLRKNLSADALRRMEDDQFSPLRDPAGDNFHYFRGADYDRQQLGLLDRYKHYNGTEGNSQALDNNRAGKLKPDVEDIDEDKSMNETESYYEYKVQIRRDKMEVGQNYIADKREATVKLRNGNSERVTWYQFKIPVRDADARKVGTINDFSSIRFMRMFMTGFKDTSILRMANFQLRKGEWRTYERSLSATSDQLGSIDVTAVNIEENGDRQPVNYVLPPGVTRILDPSQPQIRQQNEQSLSIGISDLSAGDARATYKNTWFDIRQYRRLQMFIHAEPTVLDETNLKDGEFSVFLRFGTDYKDNYYEYEVPLITTPHGQYNTYSSSDREIVWPKDNMIDIALSIFTNLKLERNRKKSEGAAVNFVTPYFIFDPNKPRNRVTVVGNPTLSDIKTIMIGVRNNADQKKSGVVWVNDLRLTDYNEDGGWAANANVNVALSDLGSVNVGGRIETAGFGGLDQSLNERRIDDLYQYNIVTNLQFGKFFPEKAKVSIPFYYGYSKERLSPKFNPLDQDVLLSDVLDNISNKRERDSISAMSIDQIIRKGFSFSNVKVDIKSKNPMPYDPANFALGFGYSIEDNFNPSTEYEKEKDVKANFSYLYTPFVKPFEPFGSMKSKSKHLKAIKDFGIGYLPNNIGFETNMTRYYYELLLRDLSGAPENIMAPSYKSEFYWNRAFSIRWDLLKSLQLSFNSGTNARIEDGLQVRSPIGDDESVHGVIRDSIWSSMKKLGTPMKYDQAFDATYTLPTKSIPILDWTTASASYKATYNWDKGAELLSDAGGKTNKVGNVISNQRDITVTGKFTLKSLYDKSKYLKEVNQRFEPKKANSRTAQKKKPDPPKKFEREIQLNMDSTINVAHNLDTKKPKVSARNVKDSLVYALRFKALNKKEIRLLNKDSMLIKLTVVQPTLSEERTFWTELGQYSTRFLMMVRSFDVSYKNTYGSHLPGFDRGIGDVFGQSSGVGGLSPGLDFAFGFTGEEFLNRAVKDGMMVNDKLGNVMQAMFNAATRLDLKAAVEPVKGLKIDLTAGRSDSKNSRYQYAFGNSTTDGMPVLRGGTFNITTVALASVFGKSNGSNNYQSEYFDKFLDYRNVMVSRLQTIYGNTPGKVERNSSDAMIPAFIAAYTGKNPTKTSLSPFPSLKSLLPNWKLTYDGLNQIAFIQEHLKSLTLKHGYKCVYSVGAYSSHQGWTSIKGRDDFGVIKSQVGEGDILTSPYDITSVTITEAFEPLIGVDVVLKNNIKFNVEYKTTRNLNLNIASLQIVEALTKDIVIGTGYTVSKFNEVLGMKPSTTVSNDLILKVDFSIRNAQSVIRKIEEQYSQATTATRAVKAAFSADYALSKMLTMRVFYDLQINKPLVSSTASPSSTSNYGIMLRFSMQR